MGAGMEAEQPANHPGPADGQARPGPRGKSGPPGKSGTPGSKAPQALGQEARKGANTLRCPARQGETGPPGGDARCQVSSPVAKKSGDQGSRSCVPPDLRGFECISFWAPFTFQWFGVVWIALFTATEGPSERLEDVPVS